MKYQLDARSTLTDCQTPMQMFFHTLFFDRIQEQKNTDEKQINQDKHREIAHHLAS